MIIFDAIIGHNDRHFYNWGVIVSTKKNLQPFFSPIYDTARALFWNEADVKIKKIYDTNRKLDFLNKYITNSSPKTGWDGCSSLNHFDLIKKIWNNKSEYREVLLASHNIINFISDVSELLENKYFDYFISERRKMIIECLEWRYRLYNEALS